MMRMNPPRAAGPVPEATLSTGSDLPMTPEQAETLRQLAQDALEHDAFSENLTRAEAAQRIAMLKAKLTLMSEPPHTV